MVEASSPGLSTKSQPAASTARFELTSTQSWGVSTSQFIISSPTPTFLLSIQSLNNTSVLPRSTSLSSASFTESSNASTGNTSISSLRSSSVSTWSSNDVNPSINSISRPSSVSIPLSPTPGGSAVATTPVPQADSVSRSIPAAADKFLFSSDALLRPLSSTLDDIDIDNSHSPSSSAFPQRINSTHIANVAVSPSRSLSAFSAASTQPQKAVPIPSPTSSSTTSRSTEPLETATIPVIAVESSVKSATFADDMVSSAITNTLTTSYSTNLISGSGAVIAGQIVDVTQASVEITPTFVTTTPTSSFPTSTDASVKTLSENGTNMLLIAVLVPVLVSVLVILPCIILVVRWHRRRSTRFMPDYGFVPNPSDYPPNTIRRPSNPPVATTDASRYSSVPSPSMVHTDLLPRTFVSQSRTPPIRRDLSLRGWDDDIRSSLFVDTNLLPILPRERGTSSPSPSSTRSQSSWRPFSPTSSIAESIHRVRSRMGTLSSTRRDSHSPSELRASSNPLSPILYQNEGRGSQFDDPFADADWNHMDDPFANVNARSVDLGGESPGGIRKTSTSSARSGILQKIRPKY